MGKKSRRPVASKATKRTPEQRAHEVSAIREKLASLGLASEYPEVADFLAAAAAYVADGHARSGQVLLQGVGRTLVYALTTQPHLTCTATLQASPSRLPGAVGQRS